MYICTLNTFDGVGQVRFTIGDSGIVVCVCDIVLGLINVCMHVVCVTLF